MCWWQKNDSARTITDGRSILWALQGSDECSKKKEGNSEGKLARHQLLGEDLFPKTKNPSLKQKLVEWLNIINNNSNINTLKQPSQNPDFQLRICEWAYKILVYLCKWLFCIKQLHIKWLIRRNVVYFKYFLLISQKIKSFLVQN